MQLKDIVERNADLQAWAEGEKLPWNDPDFSRRMLKEHLTQEHDAASRRTMLIKKHVAWIHGTVLEGRSSRVLDLGCGPGLYAARLAALGHEIVGIDFSPASIEYAIRHSPSSCRFIHADARSADFGSEYDLVMFIYGELNAFRSTDMRMILEKAFAVVKPRGKLLIELSTFDGVEQIGNQPSTWSTAKSGLFSDRPYLCLLESFWDEEQAVATERYYVVDAETAQVTRYVFSTQSYTEAQIKTLLADIGFSEVQFYPSLTGKEEREPDEFVVVLARKP